MKILITGAAGFIGMHVSKKLLERGDVVVGIDNMSNYYDTSLKDARLKELQKFEKFNFHLVDISNRTEASEIFLNEKPDVVVHLAAQAGVRYSLENPSVYIDSNLVGFGNILEGCRATKVKHLVYASSSSVYGGNQKIPFSELDRVDSPVSLYAATKKANELMAHTYSHLFGLPTTGLRFFTVYGPWGRPDMSPFLFVKAILEGEPIKVFNHGDMMRDFTYIDDISEAVVGVLDRSPEADSQSDSTVLQAGGANLSPYRIFNIGNNSPVNLLDYIQVLEKACGKSCEKILLPMQPGDIKSTMADTGRLERWIGFKPKTSLENGVSKFVNWYRDFYKV